MSKKGLMISEADHIDMEDGDISEESNESRKKGK